LLPNLICNMLSGDRDTFIELEQEMILVLKSTDGLAQGIHRAFGSKIEEFKRVGKDCIIIRENWQELPEKWLRKRSNIYCINDQGRVKWYSGKPNTKDYYPNNIIWNKGLERKSSPNGSTTLEYPESSNSFITSSWDG